MDKNGLILAGRTTVSIPWNKVTRVRGQEELSTKGMVIQSQDGESIVVSKAMHRFSDLAFQIRQAVPEKFEAAIEFPGLIVNRPVSPPRWNQLEVPTPEQLGFVPDLN